MSANQKQKQNPNRPSHKLERSNATAKAESPLPPPHYVPSMMTEVAGTTGVGTKNNPAPCLVPPETEQLVHGSILGPPATPPPQISVLSRESSTESSGSYSSESSPVGKLGVGIQDLATKMDKRRTFSGSGSGSLLETISFQEKPESSQPQTVSDPEEKEPDPRSRRTRSLNAPSPIQQFGPCGRIMKNSAMVMQIQDPAFQRLTWYKTPLTVLVIKKTRDVSVLNPFVQLTRWLIEEKRMVVHIESAVLDDNTLVTNPQFISIREKLQVFREGRDDLTDKIDFIICLGGDGTLLYASSLFQQSVPPVMAFHLGSLGFLTPFLFDNFQEQVTNVLEGHAALTLRSRLKCILKRRSASESSAPQSVSVPATKNGPIMANGIDKTANKPPGSSSLNFLVLNEVVVDRGPSPYLSNVDLFIDGKHVTVVQGDGLIVSTPTGSTAYAVAAGASMIHPSVPAIMITPICPHSLSFRPIVVPAGVELKIKISPDSRNTAWVSFDGRNRQELHHGDTLSVTTSVYPVPSICAQDQIQDWFDSLADCLQWNVRKRQKTFEDADELDNSDSYDLMET